MPGDAKTCHPNSHLKTGSNAKQSIATSSNLGTNERPNRKRRLQLSCGECREKKLSCDRNLPCQRCTRTGRPERCSFETATAQLSVSNSQFSQQQARRNSEEIRDLRAEVAQLRGLLSKGRTQDASGGVAESLRATDDAEFGQATLPNENLEEDQNPTQVTKTDLSDPRERNPRGYYGQHTLFQFFREIPQLFPFVKETADEWLKPLGVDLKKDKFARNDWIKDAPFQPESLLEGLILPKNDTDALVLFYLDHFEQLHRVVHIPTFKREYANFWVPGRPCYPAMTALVLSMISISACASVDSGDSTSIPSRHRTMPVQWVSACDEWLRQQSSKQRKLVHYQVSCLVYLAKRMNTIRKKRFWKETGSLIQNATIDGLNCAPSPAVDSPYMREMKGRIWAVLRELDLQNAFEYGLPTLLHNVHSNVAAPANLNDEDFDEASKVLPISKPPSQYTCTSYQFHSSRSWTLRLEISRRLFSTESSKALSYEDVLRYTHEITQAIHSLPPWDTDEVKGENRSKLLILTYAFLSFQLKECILAIHRPYLQKDSSKFWLSENVCHHMSRDILLLNSKLAGLGIQSLTLLREDLLLASLNLTRITLLQPKGSTSTMMTSAESTIDLLEQCLPLTEDRYLRCFHGEPWCFVTMSAAIMLLKIHIGKESWQTAKSSCAQRFLRLHYKYHGIQQTSLSNQQHSKSQDSIGQLDNIPPPGTTIFPASAWLDGSYSDIGIDPFDLDMEWDSIWET